MFFSSAYSFNFKEEKYLALSKTKDSRTPNLVIIEESRNDIT
jgi:hypothetical protein